jgi:hypothetical protein
MLSGSHDTTILFRGSSATRRVERWKTDVGSHLTSSLPVTWRYFAPAVTHSWVGSRSVVVNPICKLPHSTKLYTSREIQSRLHLQSRLSKGDPDLSSQYLPNEPQRSSNCTFDILRERSETIACPLTAYLVREVHMSKRSLRSKKPTPTLHASVDWIG